MKYSILQSLQLAHFQQMYLLELTYYKAAFITPAEEAYNWYKRFPNSTIAAANEQGDIIGFINLFPVQPHIFKQIENGTFNDAELKVEDIVDITKNEEPLQMFLSCIVVSNSYRGLGVTQLLLKTAKEKYKSVEHRCQYIITDNITDAGQHFSKKYGFMKQQATKHQSFIYKQLYADFVKLVTAI